MINHRRKVTSGVVGVRRRRALRVFVFFFFFETQGSLSAAWERVRVYCSRTDQGIKFHTSMKGFTLLTNDI